MGVYIMGLVPRGFTEHTLTLGALPGGGTEADAARRAGASDAAVEAGELGAVGRQARGGGLRLSGGLPSAGGNRVCKVEQTFIAFTLRPTGYSGIMNVYIIL